MSFPTARNIYSKILKNANLESTTAHNEKVISSVGFFFYFIKNAKNRISRYKA